MKSDKLKLFEHCQRFIAQEQIRCAESIYQCDNVILNAYTFIEGICNIVGYDQSDEDDDCA